MNIRLTLLLIWLLAASPAIAQSVQQSGTITPNHAPYWVTNGIIGDGGTSADSPISTLGITNNTTTGFCVSSGRQSAAGRQQLCFGAPLNAPAQISLQNFGTASAQNLQFVINGTIFPFPGSLAQMIIGSTPVTGGINGDCLTVSSGILSQTGCSILTAGITGTGSIVLNNSPTMSGTIGGNVTFSGSITFSGNASFGGNLIVNGTVTPASSAGNTVVLGTITAPTLANNGQGYLFNTTVGGATVSGQGSSFDVTLANKNGAAALEITTGTTGVVFPGVLTLSGLSPGTCANSVVLDSSNHTILGSCPGAASSIQVGSTTISSGTTGNLLYNNAGTLGNETIASILTAGTGISVTGTTNATIATNFVAGAGISITGSGAQTIALSLTSASVQATPTNPTGVGNTTAMLGFGVTGAGGGCRITPQFSGRLLFEINLSWTQASTAGTSSFQLKFADNSVTTAPANGAASTGTSLGGNRTTTNAINGGNTDVHLGGLATGLTVGHVYWFDVAVVGNAGATTTPSNVDCNAMEFYWMLAIETSSRFLACLPFILKEEGGYSNDPHDPGGMTMEGILQREYDFYRTAHGLPHQWVEKIGDNEVKEIYFHDYWMPHCPNMQSGLDLTYFDLCVNGGPMRATFTMQRALGIHTDGQWGPKTQAAIEGIKDVISVIQSYAMWRERFYRSLPTFRYFGSGWVGRTHRCAAASIAMVKAA